MTKFRKKAGFLIMFAMLICMVSAPVFAGNSNIGFSLGNTGRRFNTDANSANTKTSPGSVSGWVINLYDINFQNCSNLSSSLGMAFLPVSYRATGGEGPGYYAAAASPYWTKAEGKYYHSYGAGYGALGEYCLSARLDDILYGTGTASGIWNSDTI